MNPFGPDDELISAYLDDELSTEERAYVERLLVERPEARRLLDPHHETRLSRLDVHLRALGWRMRLEAIDDAA